MRKNGDEKIKQCKIKKANEKKYQLTCTCNNNNTRTHFSYEQAEKIFKDVYRFNITRCIICKYYYISLMSEYPMPTKTEEERRNFHLDHMIPYSKCRNNCLQHNIVPICSSCNGTKSDTLDYVPFCIANLISEYEFRFYLDCYKNEEDEVKFKLKSKTMTECDIINYLKNNKEHIQINYSGFIISELTETAKYHQLRIIRKYFIEKIGYEPCHDIIFYNNSFYLSSYSINQKYYDNNTKIEQKYFTFMNSLLRIKNNLYFKNLEELKEELLRMGKKNETLELTDFLAGVYYYDNNMIDTIINTIIYVYEIADEYNIIMVKNLSYSHFISSDMTQENIYRQLNYCKEKFNLKLNCEPIYDIKNDNGFLIANPNIKQIHFPIPDFLIGNIDYDYYGEKIK